MCVNQILSRFQEGYCQMGQICFWKLCSAVTSGSSHWFDTDQNTGKKHLSLSGPQHPPTEKWLEKSSISKFVLGEFTEMFGELLFFLIFLSPPPSRCAHHIATLVVTFITTGLTGRFCNWLPFSAQLRTEFRSSRLLNLLECIKKSSGVFCAAWMLSVLSFLQNLVTQRVHSELS